MQLTGADPAGLGGCLPSVPRSSFRGEQASSSGAERFFAFNFGLVRHAFAAVCVCGIASKGRGSVSPFGFLFKSSLHTTLEPI